MAWSRGHVNGDAAADFLIAGNNLAALVGGTCRRDGGLLGKP